MLSKATTRATQKLATRSRILDAARNLLEASGYEAANLRAIASQAGVSTGAVLQHFKDKQDLLHTALFEDLDQRWTKLQSKHQEVPLDTSLTQIAKAFFDYYARRPKLSRALLRESLFADPPWNERFAAQVADVHRHVAGLCVAAQKRGELAKDVDPALFGATFFSFYYFALLAWVQGGHRDPLGLFKNMLRQHLKGLQ
ncbi:MAG: TetR/AcrR family transcriptional regulator [Bryobacteraceae bacterium]